MLMLFNSHELADVGYYICFVIGQFVYLLKLADTAARGHNGISSRKEYLQLNWVPLLIRMSIFEGAIFMLYRHYGLVDKESWFPSWLPHGTPPQYWYIFPCMGYLSDSLLDWLSTYPKIPNFIRAQIPAVPQGIVATVKTQTTVVPVDENVPVTVSKTEVDVTGPLPEKDK